MGTTKGKASILVTWKVEYLATNPTTKTIFRKAHLQHTTKAGAVCKAGKVGGQLGGKEFIVFKFKEFESYANEQQCQKCKNSKIFSFLIKG